jgi:predicted nucleic acid-binding protein
MILIDTNVISEIGKDEFAEPKVRAWFNGQRRDGLFISAITVMEVMDGIGMLPEGKRRAKLDFVMSAVLQRFDTRILSFDFVAAVGYAQIKERTRRAGYNVGGPDAMIAAIAAAAGYAVATRDEAAFKAMGARVVNPWTV